MTHNTPLDASRRTVLKGAAWSMPVIGAAVMAPALAASETSDGPPRPSLFRRAQMVIAGAAAGAELTPAILAGHVNTSLRSLQRVYAERGTTVATEIRRARALIARDLLASPEWKDQSATRVAEAAGFPSPKAMRTALEKLG